MASQEIIYHKKKNKQETQADKQKQPQKQSVENRRQHITRNNSTPSKVCPRCGGPGRVKA